MKRNLLATAVGLLLASTAGATILEWSPEEKRVYFEKREAFTFQTEIEDKLAKLDEDGNKRIKNIVLFAG